MYEEISEIEFKGTIDINEKKSVSLSVLLTYNKFDVTDLNIKLTLFSDERDVGAYINSKYNEEIVIKGNDVEELVISNIYSNSLKGNIITLKANSVKHGHKIQKLQPSDKLHVQIKLTPAGLCNNLGSTMFSYDGSIEVSNTKHDSPCFIGKYGTYTIYTAYEYTEKIMHGRDITIRTKSSHISLTCHIENSIQFDEITNTVDDELETICTALQFITRSNVKRFETEYILERKGGIRSLTKRSQLPENLKLNSEPLMDINNISGEKLHTLITSIRDHQLFNDIKKSILYLTVSRNKTLESSFFYTFLSLDAIIDKILESYKIPTKIPPNTWRRIESSIKEHLLKECREDADLVEEVKRKLPELKRYSLKQNVSKLIEVLEIKTSDLWATKSFIEGFSEAATIRNELFHSGEIKSIDDLYQNGIRLKFLLERIILKLINWDDKRLHNFQCTELQDVNR